MRMSYLELDLFGVLAPANLPDDLSWITADGAIILVNLLLAGEEGISLRRIGASLETKDALAQLYAHSAVEWLTNKAGVAIAAVLTNKGEDMAALILAIAKNQSRGVVPSVTHSPLQANSESGAKA